EGVHSLVRQTNASNDFALACPTPTNNGPLEGAEVTGSFGACTEPTTTTTLRATTTTRPRATTTTTTVPAGTDRPLSGKKLVLKDNPSNPARRKLMVLSIDAAIKRYCMTFDGVQTFKPGKSFFTAKSPAPPACPP